MNKVKTLVVSDNETILKTVRNMEGVIARKSTVLNAKHVAFAKNIMIDNDVVKILEERLTNEK